MAPSLPHLPQACPTDVSSGSVTIQIARSFDLNDLHALSRTCRQIHFNLVQFRASLISGTVRCVNDDESGTDPADLTALRAQDPARSIRARLTRGRVGPCAHDLVAACRRCDAYVCRNCVVRLPSGRLPERLRRLCTPCLQAPLARLTGLAGGGRDAFAAPAFARGVCVCPDGAFLCRPCGQTLPGNDTMYRRIWNWRTRYSREGIGTGIGEGTEGVKCARGAACLAAQEIEVEVDCSQDDGGVKANGTPRGSSSASSEHAHDTVVHAAPASPAAPGTPGTPGHEHRGVEAGYLRQEIEGIGGLLRGKVKKRKRVGRPVREFEDEREHAVFLNREARGERRSWCGWCDRVVPSAKDLLPPS